MANLLNISASLAECARENEVNTLYNMEGRGRRPKPPLAYQKAVLVKMLFEINSFTKLVQRLRNNPDLASFCGFDDPPRRRWSSTGS